MKVDRLLSIVTLLLQRGKMTAPELAGILEVSRRTILRDIEDICLAGIPIITCQGGKGGISIAEGYKLDKNVLSRTELENIITGLKSLGSVSDPPGIQRLISKLSPAEASIGDSIFIDLASHYKSSLVEKISLIKSAITENRLISFEYYSEHGHSARKAEPYFITFKWSSWYMYGYCLDRQDFRLFKLNRLWNCMLTAEPFHSRDLPEHDLDDYFTDEMKITVLFDSSVEYLLVETYGPDCYSVAGDGRLKFSGSYTNRAYIIRWLLGFGDKAQVVEPDDIAEEIKAQAKNILGIYGT